MPCQSRRPWLGHYNYIRCRVQVMKLLIKPRNLKTQFEFLSLSLCNRVRNETLLMTIGRAHVGTRSTEPSHCHGQRF
jgi:hypothetical protein